ncbi:transposon tf2-6 polyprotein [Plakobranchus ocellatus]|uniref:Transposon tf2-6 polyprotein n=1 Tax=Plakobranchus ocellatus TaxID=259542 RepID=A0AAV4BGE9_9GAST|nr:transposon tf2-6 polyprotein [Plakobranchus ocellatus]
MTFAVNALNGLVYHELHQGGMTSERFNQFLLETSLQCNPGQEVCFIFDNARAHGRAAEANLPAQFEIQYLPPYSPFLIICENAFALWKQALKTRLAEVRHDLLDQPFNERMATLAQLAEQETAVESSIKNDSFQKTKGIVYRRFEDPERNISLKLVVLSKSMRKYVMAEAHDSITGAHLGIWITKNNVSSPFNPPTSLAGVEDDSKEGNSCDDSAVKPYSYAALADIVQRVR